MKLSAKICVALCVVGLVSALPQAGKRRRPANEAVESEPQYEAKEADPSPASSSAYNSYDQGYDAEQAKFEQSVQNSADAYNPDYGVSDGRLNFAIHGQQGPNSYKFGYDTGKGQNRVFRFEERDSYGVVHGRYGYYDNTGKLRIVNYSAHPQHGFQAEGNFGPK